MREVAALYKALADETRLQMLWLLMHHRELCVCDFIAVLGVTQSKASRHLRTLFHAGLVDDRRDGLWVHYSLRRDAEPLARATLRALEAGLAARPEAGALLETLTERLADRADETAGEKCA